MPAILAPRCLLLERVHLARLGALPPIQAAPSREASTSIDLGTMNSEKNYRLSSPGGVS